MDSLALRSLALAALIVAAAGGCTARTASPDAPDVPAAGAATPAPVAPEPGLPPELGALAAGTTGAAASVPDRGCETDDDCAVKDVGSCCGYFPMCVNRDARTDPAGVRAQCERDGLSSVCGFPEVRGCRCVQGRCENLADDAVER